MKRHLLAGLAAALALVLGAPDSGAAASRWGKDYIPNLPVITQDGKTLHFYDDLIQDKLVVISFIYTNCTGLCPLTTARMAEMRDMLGEAVGRDVFFISLSVDPEHDTPELMKAFADAYQAGDGPDWRFVTGTPEDINAINARFGDKSAAPGERGARGRARAGDGEQHRRDPVQEGVRGVPHGGPGRPRRPGPARRVGAPRRSLAEAVHQQS